MTDPALRFSDRVADYIKYRPGYPAEALDFIIAETHLEPGAAIADIGSGTGIFSELLLKGDYTVYGVEPNEPMRNASEKLLAAYEHFYAVAGNASATTLPAHSVDLVTAATAFHWFDHAPAQEEFRRILKPGGYTALLWNVRKPDADEFSQGYENLLRQLPDYLAVSDKYGSYEQLASFFIEGSFRQVSFENRQSFDLDGLKGRAKSSSFVPQPDTPEGVIFYSDLEKLFYSCQQNAKVNFYYDTMVYLGQV